jgi:hypothetical protein
MSEKVDMGFGHADLDVARRWSHYEPTEDGPIWMVNLMRYRERAVYEGSESTISGQEADDLYAPVEVLGDIGALVILHGPILEQSGGGPAFHRVGIVRYPTRKSFMEMQRRPDFQNQYVHKEAGMEFTIVMGCLPVASGRRTLPRGRVRVTVSPAPPVKNPEDDHLVIRLEVEGTIVGDERSWAQVVIDESDGSAPLDVGALSFTVDAAIDRLRPALTT